MSKKKLIKDISQLVEEAEVILSNYNKLEEENQKKLKKEYGIDDFTLNEYNNLKSHNRSLKEVLKNVAKEAEPTFDNNTGKQSYLIPREYIEEVKKILDE